MQRDVTATVSREPLTTGITAKSATRSCLTGRLLDARDWPCLRPLLPACPPTLLATAVHLLTCAARLASRSRQYCRTCWSPWRRPLSPCKRVGESAQASVAERQGEIFYQTCTATPIAHAHLQHGREAQQQEGGCRPGRLVRHRQQVLHQLQQQRTEVQIALSLGGAGRRQPAGKSKGIAAEGWHSCVGWCCCRGVEQIKKPLPVGKLVCTCRGQCSTAGSTVLACQSRATKSSQHRSPRPVGQGGRTQEKVALALL